VLALEVPTRVFDSHGPAGPAASETVVWVGGNPSYGAESAKLAAILPTQGYRLVTYDRLGHGRTPSPARKDFVEADIQHLHEILENLAIRQPLLMGSSQGGAIALMYAARYHDVRGVVLLGSETESKGEHQDPWMRSYTWPVFGHIISESFGQPIACCAAFIAVKMAIALPCRALCTNESLRAYHLKASTLFSRQSDIRTTVRSERDMLHNLDKRLWQDTNSVGCLSRLPVTALCGEKDPIVKPSRHSLKLNRRLPGAAVIAIPGAGHQLHITNPNDVANAVRFTSAWAKHGLADQPAPQDFGLPPLVPAQIKSL
jgi:2-succinyl-6-hydroxy-2,4-cyclohexadiene-1-carboxylate synthase